MFNSTNKGCELEKNTAFSIVTQNTSELIGISRGKIVVFTWAKCWMCIGLNVYWHIENSEKLYEQEHKDSIPQIYVFEQTTYSDFVDCLPNIYSSTSPCLET